MKDFRDLEVWKESRNFRREIRRIAKQFPREEQFILTSQIIRSVSSITANIAEGFGRYHHQENIQFCRIAKGSLTETLDHLTVALDEKYIDNSTFDELYKQYEVCIKLINGYTNYLQKQKLK
jgi:four helix bundle protein